MTRDTSLALKVTNNCIEFEIMVIHISKICNKLQIKNNTQSVKESTKVLSVDEWDSIIIAKCAHFEG